MGQTRQTDPNVVSIGLARGRRAGGSLGGAVLLLEPQESDRLMVERVLTKAGMRVVSATDEDAGLDLVVDEDPRVIVASQALPSGIDKIVKIEAIQHESNGNIQPVPTPAGANYSAFEFSYYVYNNEIVQSVGTSLNSVYGTAYFTVWYTKN